MVRYKPSQFTKKELEIMVTALATDAGIDLLTGGKLNKYKRKAAIGIYNLIKPAAKPVGRGLGALAARSAAAAAPVALPVYGGYLGAEMARRQYEQQGLEALREVPLGYPILPTLAERLDVLGTPLSPTIDVLTPAEKVKGKVSTYAKNVGKVMKAVKASTKGGPKGKLSNPKKTFATVSKAVSKRMKGKRIPKTGISGITTRIVKAVVKRKQRRKKKPRSSPGRRY